jgi:hypothetical protein
MARRILTSRRVVPVIKASSVESGQCRPAQLRLLALLVLLLGSCSNEFEELGAKLRTYGEAFPTAFLSEPYRAQIQVTGGLRPLTFNLAKGVLPEGISLESGLLVGTPTTLGNFSFTIVVSDAKLSKTFQEFKLEVTEPPAPEMTLNVPFTDVQGNVKIRAEVNKARHLQSLRTWVRWDPTLFDLVQDSPRSHRSTYAVLFETQPGIIKVDFAVLGSSISGETRLFNFVLKPRQPGPLRLSHETEYRSALGIHAFSAGTEGPVHADEGSDFPADLNFPARVDHGKRSHDRSEGESAIRQAP